MAEYHSKGGKTTAILQRNKALQEYYNNPNICLNCCQVIPVPDNMKVAEVRRKKFCNRSCAAAYNNHGRKKEKPLRLPKEDSAKFRTKGDLIDRLGYYKARKEIRKHAWKVYKKSGLPFVCKVCGYSLYAEVCHIISVADFSREATLAEINDILNLIALCPNHHWEFDHGFLQIESSVLQNPYPPLNNEIKDIVECI